MKILFIIFLLFASTSIFAQSEIRTTNPLKVVTRDGVPKITLDTSGVLTSKAYENDTVSFISSTVIDWSKGNIFKKTLSTPSTEFTFSNVSFSIINVILSNPSTYTVTWPVTIKWPLGIIPVQSNNKIDIYTFIYDGTNIYGSAIQAY